MWSYEDIDEEILTPVAGFLIIFVAIGIIASLIEECRQQCRSLLSAPHTGESVLPDDTESLYSDDSDDSEVLPV